MRKSQTAKLQLWNVCMNYNYILTNKCACEKWEKKLALTTFHFFFEILTPQLFATPKKKRIKENNAPIFETRIYDEYWKKKKWIFCETAKKVPFNWCNTVLFWLQLCIFCFLSHHLLTLLHFLLPKREFQYTFQVGTTTFFAFLSVTLYAFFLALNS